MMAGEHRVVTTERERERERERETEGGGREGEDRGRAGMTSPGGSSPVPLPESYAPL